MATYSTSKRLIRIYDGKNSQYDYCGAGPVNCTPTRLRVRWLKGEPYSTRKHACRHSMMWLIVVKTKKGGV